MSLSDWQWEPTLCSIACESFGILNVVSACQVENLDDASVSLEEVNVEGPSPWGEGESYRDSLGLHLPIKRESLELHLPTTGCLMFQVFLSFPSFLDAP